MILKIIYLVITRKSVDEPKRIAIEHPQKEGKK
jgi:hypothetical protein